MKSLELQVHREQPASHFLSHWMAPTSHLCSRLRALQGAGGGWLVLSLPTGRPAWQCSAKKDTESQAIAPGARCLLASMRLEFAPRFVRPHIRSSSGISSCSIQSPAGFRVSAQLASLNRIPTERGCFDFGLG